ncbi:MAG: SpoIIE family protein phosphatase [Candidatus Sumerlaeaceae bacterium]|nr:SpoIIE family protein phosphatase [Candidatus Sumerlaeaceae bacterium]
MSIPWAIYFAILVAMGVWVIRLKAVEKEQAQALEKIERERRAVFMFLNNLGERLTTSRIAMEPALQIIIEFIVDRADAEAGAIFLLDPADNQLAARVVQGMFPLLNPTTERVLTKQKYLTERVKRERIPLGQGVIGEAALTGKPILVADAANDPRVPNVTLGYLTIRSIMAVPLRARGVVTGVVAVVNKREEAVFTQADLDLLLMLADQAASTAEMVKLYNEQAEKQRIEQELRIAHDFQRMLLPSECPDVPGYEIAAFSRPALEVGGDYYDFFWVDPEQRHLGIVIADVSGKGIPGAFVMAMVRCTLRVVARGRLSPREVLVEANSRLYADTKENVFVTMTYGILDTQRRTFRFSRAGHEPLVTVKYDSGAVRLTSPDGIALGMVDNDLFQTTEEAELHLEPGEAVVLYTDGVVEAMDPEAREYGQKRFFDFLVAQRHSPPQEIIENALKDIEAFTRGHPQHDDITLVALRVRTDIMEVRVQPVVSAAPTG